MRVTTTGNKVVIRILPIPDESVMLGDTEIMVRREISYGKVSYHESDLGLLNEQVRLLKKRGDSLGTYQLNELSIIRKRLVELGQEIAALEENEVMPEEKFNIVDNVQNNGVVVSVPSHITMDTYGKPLDNDMVLQVGDSVWFHHNVRKDNFHLEGDLYWCPYDMVYAYKRDGEVKTVGDWCLAEIDMETEGDIRTGSGIMLKAVTGAKYLSATLSVIGIPKRAERWMWEKWGRKVGDKIIYSPTSDMRIKVDGKVFYRMQFEDIMLVDRDGWRPVREWVMVRPEPPQTKMGFLDIPDAFQRPSFTGEVVGRGNGCRNVQEGMRVVHTSSWNYEYNDMLMIPEDNILMEIQ